ncbi:hypothetical protein [Rhodoferax sp.]|uniref:hypothetical protein n=1 Tax=Rhodoferax sp. TaxID=50421 RepID=UPI0025E93461|nr:hypothetical protein [Rhodoferax sp.]
MSIAPGAQRLPAAGPLLVLDIHVISEFRHGMPHQSPEVRAWAGAQPASWF